MLMKWTLLSAFLACLTSNSQAVNFNLVQPSLEADGEESCGWSTSMSDDGSVAAVGCYSTDRISIYRDNGSQYILESYLKPETFEGLLGYSLALSGDGNRVAMSAQNENNTEGAIWIAAHGDDGTWKFGPKIMVGARITSLSVSRDLTRVAVSTSMKTSVFYKAHEEDQYRTEGEFEGMALADLNLIGNGSVLSIVSEGMIRVARFSEEQGWNVVWKHTFQEDDEWIVDHALSDDAQFLAFRTKTSDRPWKQASVQMFRFNAVTGMYDFHQLFPPMWSDEDFNKQTRRRDLVGVDSMRFVKTQPRMVLAGILFASDPAESMRVLTTYDYIDDKGVAKWQRTSPWITVSPRMYLRHPWRLSLSSDGKRIISAEASEDRMPTCLVGLPKGTRLHPGFLWFWKESAQASYSVMDTDTQTTLSRTTFSPTKASPDIVEMGLDLLHSIFITAQLGWEKLWLLVIPLAVFMHLWYRIKENDIKGKASKLCETC